MSNQFIVLSINADKCPSQFPECEETSLKVSVCPTDSPKPKNIQFYSDINLKILTSDKLKIDIGSISLDRLDCTGHSSLCQTVILLVNTLYKMFYLWVSDMNSY